MEKWNICLINDSFPPIIDGVATVTTNYATILSKNENYGGAEVVTPDVPGADDSAFPFPVLRYPSFSFVDLQDYRVGNPFSPKILKKLGSSGVDLIHSHCPFTATMLACSLRDRIHVPVVFTYHTKFDVDIDKAIKAKALREAAIKLIVENATACDEVWTVSAGAGENLRSLGYEGDYIVMPNGVDLPRGRVEDTLVRETVAGFDLPEELPVLLFVGRMMWYKGVKISIDALAALHAEGRDFRMVFVGGGTDRGDIIDYTKQLGLEKKILFADALHDRELLRAWYCRADLFLFPSTFDTNGLVVREAAACALPSVLIRGSCAAEDVTDGVNGFLIEENAESMAALLRRVMADRALLRKVGENAERELYLSWEDAIKKAYDRYAVVIENYRRGLYPQRGSRLDKFYHNMSVLAKLLEPSGKAER